MAADPSPACSTAPAMTSTSRRDAVSMSAPSSAATISPWFCISVIRGTGPPVRRTWAARASRMACASGRPGSVYGTHRTSSPNRRRAIASPSSLHVTALITIGWVCSTNRSGISAWNRSSTEGRRPPAGPSRACSAARITGSPPSPPDATGASSVASRLARSSGTRSAASSVASGTPLGLIHTTPSAFAEAFPPPPRENSGSSPNRWASAISSPMTGSSAAGGSIVALMRRPLRPRSPGHRAPRTSGCARRRRAKPGAGMPSASTNPPSPAWRRCWWAATTHAPSKNAARAAGDRGRPPLQAGANGIRSGVLCSVPAVTTIPAARKAAT